MKKIVRSFIFVLMATLATQNLKAAEIHGNVLYQGDSLRPISNVVVELRNIDNNSITTTVSGANGYYEFINVPNGNYFLTGNTLLTPGGVTYYDPTLLFLYLNGLYQLTPIQTLASDVDGNGVIDWTDYNLIVDFLLNGTPFPVGSWRFESKVFSVSGMKEGVPHGISGTCSGDVGGTFVPMVNHSTAMPLAQVGETKLSTGEEFTTRIFTRHPITMNGAGIVINFPSNLVSIESIAFKGVDYKYTIADGQIRIVWGNPNTEPINFKEGETFVTIHGTTSSSFTMGMVANLGLDGNTCIMDISNNEIKNLDFATPALTFGNALKFSNYPNPVVSTTKFTVFAPMTGSASIDIYDNKGQLIKSMALGQIAEGTNEIPFDASQMAAGQYFCKLHMLSAERITKLVKVD